MECRSSATDGIRVCGVDLVESFAGQTGPLVVVTRCDEGRRRNRVCAFKLDDIDGDMDAFFTGCVTGVHSESDLPCYSCTMAARGLRGARVACFHRPRGRSPSGSM